MLELKYGKRRVELDVELLVFLEKNSGSAKTGREDFIETLEKKMNCFLVKFSRKYDGEGREKLRENVLVCFELFSTGKEVNPAELKRNGELKKVILNIIDNIG